MKRGKVLGFAVAFVALATLAALGSLLLARQRGAFARRFATSVQVRYLDAQGKEIQAGTSAAGTSTSPADLSLEISLPDTAESTRAVLFLFDSAGQQLGDLVALEPAQCGLRTVVSLRKLPPLSAVERGVLLIAPRSALEVALRSLTLPLDLHAAASVGAPAQSFQVEIRIPGLASSFEPRLLDAAERRLAHGDFATALAQIETLAATLPEHERARAALVGAEAAFGYGRTALARGIARVGLASRQSSSTVTARLRRVEILAIAEGSESTEPPPERELLRQTARERSDALEQALDAALDLRLAMLHDRFSREPPRARARALELLHLVSALKPEQLPVDLAVALCRAVEVAASTAEAYDQGRLESANALVRASENPAAIAECAIGSGELFIERSQWPDAERALAEVVKALSGADLPREQRQAWYLAALLAARRNDFPAAFEQAKRAVRSVGRLLALETEPTTREQLLINTLAYYCAAARFGVLAGSSAAAAAIAVAESGKGNALASLTQSTPVDDFRRGSVTALRDAQLDDAFTVETARIVELGRTLGAKDAALSYMLLGTNAARRFELAIGVVSRDAVTVKLVEEPDTFNADVVALAQAVEQNQEATAKELGMRLYATLIAPVAAQLAEKERLFVSPHLRLHTVPWNALHDGSDFLVHRFAFSRSLPLLLRNTEQRDDSRPLERRASARWLLALNPRHPGHESLPGFEGLGSELARRIPSATVLGPSQATAEQLSVEIRRADVMLFAGHATYAADDPLRSALLTAASAADAAPSLWPSDRLEARALLKLEKRLDLAILLGCETARLWRGTSSYGDEAVGLARAFLLTGAHQVIGALLPVLDRDAEDFLRAFVSMEGGQDVVRQMQQANRCLAQHRCAGRGIAGWASFSLESR